MARHIRTLLKGWTQDAYERALKRASFGDRFFPRGTGKHDVFSGSGGTLVWRDKDELAQIRCALDGMLTELLDDQLLTNSATEELRRLIDAKEAMLCCAKAHRGKNSTWFPLIWISSGINSSCPKDLWKYAVEEPQLTAGKLLYGFRQLNQELANSGCQPNCFLVRTTAGVLVATNWHLRLEKNKDGKCLSAEAAAELAQQIATADEACQHRSFRSIFAALVDAGVLVTAGVVRGRSGHSHQVEIVIRTPLRMIG